MFAAWEVKLMPELPEIETIKRVIEPQIKGLLLEQAEVRRPEVIAHPAADEFSRRLVGQSVSHLTRSGKFLTFHLASRDRIILHLRMTGCLLFAPADFPEEKHTHLVFRFSNNMELRFSDTRRFGRVWLLQNGEADTYSGIEKLGLEPFSPDFTAEYLNAHLGKRKKTVKECLLDQSVVAGTGNIYADEILFAAGIYPALPANRLGRAEWERLAAAIPERLAYFIEVNQISPEEYWETKGQDYRNTPFLQVYGQKDKPCPRCKTALCKMTVGGRSSVYCPSCQRNRET